MVAARKTLTVLIALVWLFNGLYCKLLNFVPRHQQIVARILGNEHAGLLTKAIGLAECILVIWILSGFYRKWAAWAQITAVATMNLIEFILVPDLLLFGRWNALIALAFIILVYCNSFILQKPRSAASFSWARS